MLNTASRKNILKYWLPMAVIITGLAGLIYLAIQQDLRSSANDPQIQMVEDAAIKLENGAQYRDINSVDKVDLSTSLSPYMIIFDNNGKPVASSAILDGSTPTVPSGVFDYVRRNHNDLITWQPKKGVREAVDIVKYGGKNPGFVLAGRSLREAENREDSIMHDILLGWVVTLAVSFIATAILAAI